MKTLVKDQAYDIPDGVTMTVKARVVTVKGSRGTIVHNATSSKLQAAHAGAPRAGAARERWSTSLYT